MMPDEDPNAISEKQKSRENSSPVPGCAILATIIIVFGGLIVLYAGVGYYQATKMLEFTDESQAEIPAFVPTEAQVKHANRQLAAVASATAQDATERIGFSADDLNTMIATQEKLAGFRGNTFISKVVDKAIEVQMSQPVRQIGFKKPHRYLNGTFVFKPEVRARTLAFKLTDIRQKNRETKLPDQFIVSFSATDFFKIALDDKVLEPVFRRLKRISIEGGQVYVETTKLKDE